MFVVQARKKHFFHLVMFGNNDHRQLVRAVQNVRVRCFVQHLRVAVKNGVQEINFFRVFRDPLGELYPCQPGSLGVIANVE